MWKRLTFLTLFMASTGSSAEIVVVAHSDVTADSLSRQRLTDYYTGDIRSWTDGTPLVVLDLQSRGKIRKVFYKYLGKSPSRMKSIWMKNMLAGEGDPPEAMATEQELLEKVQATPGALGFVSLSKVDDSVKTLTVIPFTEE